MTIMWGNFELVGIDMLSTGVVGLVGVPVNIETKSEFDRATITFAYDESKLGDVNEDDLRIMIGFIDATQILY